MLKSVLLLFLTQNFLTSAVPTKEGILYFVGIYSACYERPNRTDENKLCQNTDEFLRNKIQSIKKLSLEESRLSQKQYISYDVCNDSNELYELVQTLLLNDKYMVSSSNLTNVTQSSIGFIVIQLPDPMTKLFTGLYHDAVVIGINSISQAGDLFIDLRMKILKFLIRYHEWNNILLFLTNDQTSVFYTFSNRVLRELKKLKISVHFTHLIKHKNNNKRHYHWLPKR